MSSVDLLSLLPFIVIVSWACVLLLVDLFIPRQRKGWTALLSALGLVAALGASISQIGKQGKVLISKTNLNL